MVTRRNVLLTFGGASLLPGVAGADTGTEQSFYEWCRDYIDELTDAGLTRQEARNYFEDAYGHPCGTGGIQAIGSFPFSACADVSLIRQEFCINTGTLSDGSRNCGQGSLFPETSVTVTLESFDLDGSLRYDASFWIGVREDALTGRPCLKIGNEDTGICFSECTPSVEPVISELVDVAESMVDWLDDNGIIAVTATAAVVLAALLAIVLHLLLCAIGGPCTGA